MDVERNSHVRSIEQRNSLTPKLVDGVSRRPAAPVDVRPVVRIAALALLVAGVMTAFTYQQQLQAGAIGQVEAWSMIVTGGVSVVAAALLYQARLAGLAIGMIAMVILASMDAHQLIKVLGEGGIHLWEPGLLGLAVAALLLLILALPNCIQINDAKRAS